MRAMIEYPKCDRGDHCYYREDPGDLEDYEKSCKLVVNEADQLPSGVAGFCHKTSPIITLCDEDYNATCKAKCAGCLLGMSDKQTTLNGVSICTNCERGAIAEKMLEDDYIAILGERRTLEAKVNKARELYEGARLIRNEKRLAKFFANKDDTWRDDSIPFSEQEAMDVAKALSKHCAYQRHFKDTDVKDLDLKTIFLRVIGVEK